MRRKLKIVLANIIARAPTSRLRVALYRSVLGYKISRSRIGFGTVIAVERADIEGANIGPDNTFSGPMSISVADGVVIGARNRFGCGWWAATPAYEHAQFERRLTLKAQSHITTDHHFDVAGAVSIGERSWIAGAGSQIWTHGGVTDRNVTIGDDCYIGSAVRFAPGSGVADNVIVSLGSVVTKRIGDSNALVAGAPAQVIRQNYDWKTRTHAVG